MSEVYVIQMTTGQIVIGRRNEERESELELSDGSVILSYPATLDTLMGQGPDGQPMPQMSINPYLPFAEYDRNDGIEFVQHAYTHALPAAYALSEAHRNYENRIRAQDNGIEIASANDLPENQFGVDADEMTGGGLRIQED